jgi:hypothetical protein
VIPGPLVHDDVFFDENGISQGRQRPAILDNLITEMNYTLRVLLKHISKGWFS